MMGGEELDAVYTVKELAERWKCSENGIRDRENMGLLHRLTNLPGVKYSGKEVAQLEALGPDVEAHSAWAWAQLERENKLQKREIKDLRERLTRIMITCQGGGVQ